MMNPRAPHAALLLPFLSGVFQWHQLKKLAMATAALAELMCRPPLKAKMKKLVRWPLCAGSGNVNGGRLNSNACAVMALKSFVKWFCPKPLPYRNWPIVWQLRGVMLFAP